MEVEGIYSDKELLQLCKECNLDMEKYMPSDTQLEGLRFMLNLDSEHGGGILAHDVGMGKTLQALLLDRIDKNLFKDSKPTLILCPLAMAKTWISECEHYFQKSVKTLHFYGKNRWNASDGKYHIQTRPNIQMTAQALHEYPIIVAHYNALTSIWAEKVEPIRKGWRDAQNSVSEEEFKKLKEEYGSIFGWMDINPSDISWKQCPEIKFSSNRATLDFMGPLFSIEYSRIIVDEAHNMRNPNTQLALMCNALRSRSRWALTGTPIVNYTEDVWSILRFIRMNNLPPMKDFRVLARHERVYDQKERETREFWKCAKESNLFISSVMEEEEEGDEEKRLDRIVESDLKRTKIETKEGRAKGVLECILSKYMQKISKENLARAHTDLAQFKILELLYPNEKLLVAPYKQIPAAYYKEVYVKNSEDFYSVYGCIKQRRKTQYLKLKDERHLQSEASTHVFATIQFLRQICADPRILDPSLLDEARYYCLEAVDRLTDEETPYKFMFVTDYLCECNESIIVFVHFIKAAKALKAWIVSQGMTAIVITGEDNITDKGKKCEHFQSGKARVLVCTYCLSLGVTLTHASRVILLTPWWNSSEERQAWGRVHRIGQKHDVHIIHLVSSDTIDENIRHVSQKKEENEKITLDNAITLLGYDSDNNSNNNNSGSIG